VEASFSGKSGDKNFIKTPIILRIPVVDESNNPLPNQLYKISLPSGKIIFGETDSQGILKEIINESGDLKLEMEDGSTITIETT